MNRIWIGTSGWTYDGWRGSFYPRRLPKKNWLAWYAAQFPTAEINGSFYRTPSLQAVRGWREQTPDGFLFAWKASKFITHWKRLSESAVNSIELMVTRLEELGSRAGPALFQLPANFKANRERLACFLRMLPRSYRYAFEFRHPSWYDEPIFDLLRSEDAALCLSDHHEAPSPIVATAGHVYVRAHGPGGFYAGSYSDEALNAWAREIKAWARQQRTIYVYFDNDQGAAAPTDARRLTAMCGPH
jgi:uncharacterized protein YecE (DUF72 family)